MTWVPAWVPADADVSELAVDSEGDDLDAGLVDTVVVSAGVGKTTEALQSGRLDALADSPIEDADLEI